MTPAVERKERDERYVARAREIASTLPNVMIPNLAEVHEVASRDGAYVAAILWVPAE